MSQEAASSGIELLDSTATDRFASEVRADLARRGLSLRAFADQLGVPYLWTQRRLGPSRSIGISLDDAVLVADALERPLDDLIGRVA